jgi:hypothetical protein
MTLKTLIQLKLGIGGRRKNRPRLFSGRVIKSRGRYIPCMQSNGGLTFAALMLNIFGQCFPHVQLIGLPFFPCDGQRGALGRRAHTHGRQGWIFGGLARIQGKGRDANDAHFLPVGFGDQVIDMIGQKALMFGGGDASFGWRGRIAQNRRHSFDLRAERWCFGGHKNLGASVAGQQRMGGGLVGIQVAATRRRGGWVHGGTPDQGGEGQQGEGTQMHGTHREKEDGASVSRFESYGNWLAWFFSGR